MTTLVDQAVVALQSLPVDRRDELAQAIIDAAVPTIQLSDEQIAGVEAARAQVKAGEYAAPEAVDAVFAKFRAV